MALWLCRTGQHGEHESKFLSDERIYLTWDRLSHDLTKIADPQAIFAILGQVYPSFKNRHRTHHAGQIWAFVRRMAIGDWVAVPSKRKTIHIGEIRGSYSFNAAGPDPYFHSRSVKWLQRDIPRTNFDQDILNSFGAFMTICQIRRNDSEARVRAMLNHNWKSVGTSPKASGLDDEQLSTDDLSGANLDLEQIGRDQIARLIYSKFAGYKMQNLVAAILRAQGFVTFEGEKGADGGVDILASPGILGFGQPRICVQVKSQDMPLELPVLDQLVGTMGKVAADQGLLVCWGGFKQTYKSEIPRRFFEVRLWDQNDLIDEFLANYDKFDEDLRAEIPLKRIWTVASADDEED